MTLEQYLIALVKRWKLMVICIVVVGVGASIGSRFMTPIYQSTALVQIVVSSGNNQTDYNNLLASDELVQTEATLATSDPVLREVASRYPGLTVDELSKEVTATPKTNTQLFEIAINDPSPTQAAALANDIANTLIQQQLQIEQQASSRTGSFLFLAQPAQPPLKPIQPNVLVNTAAGLMAGLLLAMALTLLFEQSDTHVRTPGTLAQLLSLPVLATISQVGPKEEVVNPTGHNANVESYRILRTNIGFSAINKQPCTLKQPRTLIVTSASPREGKSVIAANLAIFMARAGKNTLLIDADLRHPTLHETFGLPAQTMGFSNAIQTFSPPSAPDMPAYQHPPTPSTSLSPSNALPATTISLDPFFHAVDIPNLCFMPSGPLPPDPPELLDSEAMPRLLRALGSRGAEVIIFDTPPLLGLSDTSILASKADGTLVVVDITRAKKGHLEQLKAILEQAGADVLGCVVNKQRRSRDHAIYSHYYTAHRQTGSNSHSRKNGHAAPVTRDIMKEPKTQLQQDLLDSTLKIPSVHPREVDTQS
ncbi:MAG TPA: Wzz/FepE/Etk N-terminal domain-containing protein [Ktedonobacteraceae bacterium]|nr:Wzz/FepE/Etk N-terminal domain-containing protein [Ktedonobacteraceae bacterium]